MLFKPPGDEVGNLCVIEFLEHEMAVSVDVRVRLTLCKNVDTQQRRRQHHRKSCLHTNVVLNSGAKLQQKIPHVQVFVGFFITV